MTDASVAISSGDDGDDVVTITLADLEPLTDYSVRIDAGAFKDSGGHAE